MEWIEPKTVSMIAAAEFWPQTISSRKTILILSYMAVLGSKPPRNLLWQMQSSSRQPI